MNKKEITLGGIDYRKAIREFVGENGAVYLTEHNYKPNLCRAAGYMHVNLYLQGTIPISTLSDETAREVFRELLEYQYYCKVYA